MGMAGLTDDEWKVDGRMKNRMPISHLSKAGATTMLYAISHSEFKKLENCVCKTQLMPPCSACLRNTSHLKYIKNTLRLTP